MSDYTIYKSFIEAKDTQFTVHFKIKEKHLLENITVMMCTLIRAKATTYRASFLIDCAKIQRFHLQH